MVYDNNRQQQFFILSFRLINVLSLPFRKVCATLGTTGGCSFDNLDEVIVGWLFLLNFPLAILHLSEEQDDDKRNTSLCFRSVRFVSISSYGCMLMLPMREVRLYVLNIVDGSRELKRLIR